MSLFIVLLFLFRPCQNELHPLALSYERIIRESLVSCALNASKSFFKVRSTVLYSLPITEVSHSEPSISTTSMLLIPALISEGQFSIIIKDTSKLMNMQEVNLFKPKNYIIHLRHENEFHKNLAVIKTSTNWNPHAKFLVMSATKFDNTFALASEILENLWMAKVINAVVLLSNPNDNTTFDVFTWFPYKDGNCEDNFNKTYIIDHCSHGDFAKQWYDNKIPKKFNQCTIKVRAIEFPPYVTDLPNGTVRTSTEYGSMKGMEINLLDMISEMLNLKMLYTFSLEPQNWGEAYPNGTVTGNLAYLKDDVVDISCGSYRKNLGRFLMFDNSISYFQETVSWCVPHFAGRNWQTLTHTISADTWLATTLLMLLLTILLWMSSFLSTTERNSYKTLIGCVQNTFAVLIGAAVKLPKTDLTRFFIAMLVLYGFVLAAAYQTLLMSSLANYKLDEQISTVDEIYEQGLKTYFIPNYKQNFENDERIMKHWNNCPVLDECLRHVAIRRDSAMPVPRLYRKYVWNSFMSSRGEPLIYCFKDSVLSYPINLLMRKGFPMYEQINDLIHQINSAGLFLKWEYDLNHRGHKNAVKYKVEVIDDEIDNLGFDSLQPVFIMLCIGNAISLGIFLGEIICYESKRFKRKYMSRKEKAFRIRT